MAQARQDQYRAAGFQHVQILVGNTKKNSDGSFNAPDLEDLEDWVAEYALDDIPVLGVNQSDSVFPSGVYYRYEWDWAIPTYVILGPDMTVLSVDSGASDPASFVE